MATKPSLITNISPMPEVPSRDDPDTYADLAEAWDEHLEGVLQPELQAMILGVNTAVNFIELLNTTISGRFDGINSEAAQLQRDLSALQISLSNLSSGLNATDTAFNARLNIAESALDDIESRQSSVETLLSDNLPELDIDAAQQSDVNRTQAVFDNLVRQVKLANDVQILKQQMSGLIVAINQLSKRTLNGVHIYKEADNGNT